MNLSLCMIVKNAEDTIARALESVVGYVDEIIVVDTGSTDRTKEIAGEYADKLVDFAWTGSFSDARNFSMDLATHDRILILDSDEYIHEDAWTNIDDALKDPHLIMATLQIVNATRQGPVVGEVFTQPRILRNEEADGSRQALRYKYAVHNQIDDAVFDYGKHYRELRGVPGSICGIDGKVIHTGYDLTPEQVIEKYTPRISTIRSEVQRCIVEKNPQEKAYYEFQLALMLHMLYNVEDAIGIWETLDFSQLNEQNRWYAHYIAARAYLKVDDFAKSLYHCGGMFEAIKAGHTKEPVSYTLTGLVMCNAAQGEDDIKQGLSFMIEGYFMSIDPPFGIRCMLNRNRILKDIVTFMNSVSPIEAALIEEGEINYKRLRGIQNAYL